MRLLVLLGIGAALTASAWAGAPKDCADRCTSELAICVDSDTDEALCQDRALACVDYCASVQRDCIARCQQEARDCQAIGSDGKPINPPDYCQSRAHECETYLCSLTGAAPATPALTPKRDGAASR